VLSIVEAVQAEINLRHGKMAEATLWAKRYKEDLCHADYRFFVPHITLARTLIAERSKTSSARALELLQRLVEMYTRCNNKRFLIHVLVLRALCLQKNKQTQEAYDSLHQAVLLAQPSGFIKLFIDAGTDLIPLFNRLKLDAQGVEYVGRILSGFVVSKAQDYVSEDPSRLAQVSFSSS